MMWWIIELLVCIQWLFSKTMWLIIVFSISTYSDYICDWNLGENNIWRGVAKNLFSCVLICSESIPASQYSWTVIYSLFCKRLWTLWTLRSKTIITFYIQCFVTLSLTCPKQMLNLVWRQGVSKKERVLTICNIWIS